MDRGGGEVTTAPMGIGRKMLRPLAHFSRQRVRLTGIGVATLCLSVFAIATWLTPSPTGIGTHRQLGYPACLSPLLTGYPCPTCGMTTSFAHAVRGQFVRAFHAQPAGFALFAMMVAACACCVRVVVTNNADFLRVNVRAGPVALMGAGIVALGWVYKLVTYVP